MNFNNCIVKKICEVDDTNELFYERHWHNTIKPKIYENTAGKSFTKRHTAPTNNETN